MRHFVRRAEHPAHDPVHAENLAEERDPAGVWSRAAFFAGKPMAGSIVGAQFIKRFVKDGTPWAHIDIAGTAWKPGPYEDPLSPAWATGYGVRLLNRLIANRYEE